MSDSFNSPNQLCLETSQESAPEPNVPADQTQQADSASSSILEAFEEDDFEYLEAEELDAMESPDSESSLGEEASFEVIADYVEAAVTPTTIASFTSETDSVVIRSQAEESLEAVLDLNQAINTETDAINALNTGLGEPAADEAEDSTFEAGSDTDENAADRDGIALDTESIEINTDAGEEEITESFTAPVEVVDVEILESQEQERSYEVHQDGSLTYFQYFLDEEESGSGDWRGETERSPRSFVSATAVGVGVLAATFGAGLLMAEATNRNSISDSQKKGTETQAKAEAERKASEASELAKASSPEATVPDWSTTQKAVAVSEGSATANPTLGSSAALLKKSKYSPSASSATSKLAPLAQSWGASITLPSATSPIVSSPIVTTASLPTPTTTPVDRSALQPVPIYQVTQPSSITTSSAALPSPPIVTATQQDEQELRSRLDTLRDRIADPIASSTVPTTTDGNLLAGPDERWVGTVPNQVNVPLNGSETTLGNALESPRQPNLTDSPYVGATVASTPVTTPSDAASASATASSSVAAAPLDLKPVVPPHQASSLEQKIVAPVAGLLATPVVPAQSKPLTPRASVTPPHAPKQVTQTSPSGATQARMAMEVMPGAIALEVIPPTLSTPILPSPVSSPAFITGNSASRAVSPKVTPQVTTPATEMAPKHQGITSITELTEIQSSRPLALSRSTAREALANAERLDQFRVLPLTVSEYQRLWQESGNDGTFAPVHGFVDYGQNVIAIVVTRGEVNEVSSATQGETHKRVGEGDKSWFVEVSAQSSQPVETVSRS